MNKKSKKLNLSIFEIVWYTLCLLIFIWGLTYIILGLVAKFAPVSINDNEVLKASNEYAKIFKMGFFEYGLIHVGVSWVLALIVLLVFSKKSDREFEKEQRRAALRASARQSMGIQDNETVVETEVVEEEPKVEEVKEEVVAEEEPKEAEEAKEEPKEEPKEEATEEEPKAEEAEEKAE